MGEVIDLQAWREQHQEPEPRRPRRRRTPGGRGFDEDATRHLSSGLPLADPADEGDDGR